MKNYNTPTILMTEDKEMKNYNTPTILMIEDKEMKNYNTPTILMIEDTLVNISHKNPYTGEYFTQKSLHW
jgi:uncharacterized protein involved in tolerance to divalent cations